MDEEAHDELVRLSRGQIKDQFIEKFEKMPYDKRNHWLCGLGSMAIEGNKLAEYILDELKFEGYIK